MKSFFAHIKVYVFRGLLAITPLVLTILIVRFIYIFFDKRMVDFIDHHTGYRVPGVGIIALLLFLYIVGLVASNVMGKKLFGVMEYIMARIPLVKTTYQVGKQLSNTLSLPEKQVFQRTVLVDFFKEGNKTVGFVTGHLQDHQNNERLLKVFVPTTPNPTTGFLILMREANTVDPGWSVEEGIRAVISGGIIGAEEIKRKA